MLHVKNARYLRDFTIWVEFDDDTQGEVNLSDSLIGPVFEPLQKIDNFRAFQVNEVLGTIVWSNGADLAPEYLQSKLH